MKSLLSVFISCFALAVNAQTEYAYQTFDDTRIVNGHSIETNRDGNLKFIISHRFGTLSSGVYNAWGLDQAEMRIGLDYGITNNLTIGIGRSTYEKTVDSFLKYKFLRQSKGDKNIPLSAALLFAPSYELQKRTDGLEITASDRVAYTAQLLVARKFTDRLSLQVMPTFLHRNFVENYEVNDILSVGFAGQYQAFKNVSFSVEYYATPTSSLPSKAESPFGEAYTQTLAFGVQIDTKGHVFQLQLGNSQGMIEKFFIAETHDSWLDGGIHLGFNITRDFKVKGRKI